MGMQGRQDIQCVTIKAEQLNFLMQTILHIIRTLTAINLMGF